MDNLNKLFEEYDEHKKIAHQYENISKNMRKQEDIKSEIENSIIYHRKAEAIKLEIIAYIKDLKDKLSTIKEINDLNKVSSYRIESLLKVGEE